MKYYLEDGDSVTADCAEATWRQSNNTMVFNGWMDCTYYYDGLLVEFEEDGRAFVHYEDNVPE